MPAKINDGKTKYQRYHERHKAERNEKHRAARYADPEKTKRKNRAAYHRNKVKIAAQRKENRKTDKYKERYKRYRERYRERSRVLERKRRASNRIELRRKSKERRDRNIEQAREKHNKYQAKNREMYRAAARKWYYKRKAEDPEFMKSFYPRAQARRARKRGAEGRYTAKDLADLFVKQGRKCASCKIGISDKKGPTKYHTDHVTPLSKGGSNYISNIALLCSTCNLSKHKKDPEQWAKECGLLFF